MRRGSKIECKGHFNISYFLFLIRCFLGNIYIMEENVLIIILKKSCVWSIYISRVISSEQLCTKGLSTQNIEKMACLYPWTALKEVLYKLKKWHVVSSFQQLIDGKWRDGSSEQLFRKSTSAGLMKNGVVVLMNSCTGSMYQLMDGVFTVGRSRSFDSSSSSISSSSSSSYSSSIFNSSNKSLTSVRQWDQSNPRCVEIFL